MNRTEAKRLAEITNNEDLKQMFINAKEGVKDWGATAKVNKGMTKGAAFNILSKCGIDNISGIAKVNCIHEFGDWLPNYEKPERKIKSKFTIHHQEPMDLDKSFFDNLPI